MAPRRDTALRAPQDAGEDTAPPVAQDTGVDSGPLDTASYDAGPPCGGPCTAGEVCDGATGKCVSPKCALPPLPDGPNVNKVSRLELEPENEGCDLDGDGTPDNVMGKVVGIYAAANDELAGAVKDGDLIVLLSPSAWKTDGSPFEIDLLLGTIDPPSKGCDATKPHACKYRVDRASYNRLSSGAGSCPPHVSFPSTTVHGTQLVAGGNTKGFEMNLPVVGFTFWLHISAPRIMGQVSDDKGFKSLTGRLCGVIAPEEFDKGIDTIPDEVVKEVGFDKVTLKSLFAGVFKPDIDTDGDGTLDAVSVSLSLASFPAAVVGWSP